MKAGYPPHSLAIIPELPIDSLGLKQGEQLMVTQKAEASSARSSAAAPSSPPRAAPTAPMTGLTRSQVSEPVTPAPSAPQASGPDYVETEGGYLVHRVRRLCSHCQLSSINIDVVSYFRLYRTITHVYSHLLHLYLSKTRIRRSRSGRVSPLDPLLLHRLTVYTPVVADEIRKDMVTWSEAILGYVTFLSRRWMMLILIWCRRPRDEYIATILKPSSWGGAIELSILAKHYNTEIDSVDVETGRIDKFTPPAGADSGNRCVLVYSGIHYDAATVAPILDAPDDFHQTILTRTSDGDDDPILVAAKKLADKLRAKRAYTNTATFDLRCQVGVGCAVTLRSAC